MLPCFYFDRTRVAGCRGRGRLPGCRFWTRRILPVSLSRLVLSRAFLLSSPPDNGRLGLEVFLTARLYPQPLSACRYLAQRPYQTRRQASQHEP